MVVVVVLLFIAESPPPWTKTSRSLSSWGSSYLLNPFATLCFPLPLDVLHCLPKKTSLYIQSPASLISLS